jgi:hypothetical protein
MLRRGDDPRLVAEQRATVLHHLASTKAALRDLNRGDPTALFEYIVPPEEEGTQPPLCLVNGNLDNCFVGTPTSKTPTSGTGSVFQAVGSPDFAHSTVTAISLTGVGAYVAPISTNGDFQNKLIHSKTITYPALTCLTTQALKSTTVHQLSAGTGVAWFSLSVSGQRLSSDSAGCTALAVAADRTTLGRNDFTNLSIGGKPATCGALTVVSSNPDVAAASNLQGDIWGIYSGSRGSATITARCADGSGGYVSITVDYPVDPIVESTGGGEDDTGFTNCSYWVWRDKWTGEWLSAPFILCPGQEPPPCCFSKSRRGPDVLVVGRDPLAMDGQSSAARQASRKTRNSAQVLFVGMTGPGAPSRAAVQLDPSGEADAIVFVNLVQAVAEDIESAIIAVSHSFNSDDTAPSNGELSLENQAFNGKIKGQPVKRSVEILGRLKDKSRNDEVAGRTGRVLKVQVDLQEVRKHER